MLPVELSSVAARSPCLQHGLGVGEAGRKRW